ncbi:cytochrome P450 [Actinosynnema sp. NPDC023794]
MSARTSTGVPDLTDPETFQREDMPDVWRRLRADAPVWRHPARGDAPAFWVVTRHEDVVAALRAGDVLASGHGNVLTSLLSGHEDGSGRMLPVTDGTRHRDLRRVLQPAFTPRALRDVERRVREHARELVRAAALAGECDFARDVAEHVPMRAICDLLGVPEVDRPALLDLTKSALGSTSPDWSDDDARLARNELLLYFTDLLADRRAGGRRGDDVIGLLAAAEAGGDPLDDADVVLNCYSLILGGDETSRLSITAAVAAFCRFPRQWDTVRAGAGLPGVVEEVLRWACPAMHVGRRATVDTTIGGTRIAAGDLVTLWITSANRDEEVFAEPDAFDATRTPNRHLALGHGAHFCLGAQLARIELGAVLEALRDVAASFTATGPATRVRSTFLDGYAALPVRITSARRSGEWGTG